MKKRLRILRCAAAVACAAWIAAGAPGQDRAAAASPFLLGDDEVRCAVERELASDPAVPAHRVTVEVSSGIVTLLGRIDNLLAKERAERIAETVKGVRVVVNRILVLPSTRRSDDALERDVRAALIEDPVADASEVGVRVDHGTVSLSGTVDSWQEYRSCEWAAKAVKGVVRVRNGLQVDYVLKRPDAEIQIEILERLRWDALIDHGLIRVLVADGQVELHGTVGSAAEKMRAVYDAYVAGVASVDASGLEVERWARDDDLRGGQYIFRDDAEIKKTVRDAFSCDPRVSYFDVQVEVSAGRVTLRGEVDAIGAKRAAGQDARNTAGVRAVENRIQVRPPRPGLPAEERPPAAGGHRRRPLVEPVCRQGAEDHELPSSFGSS